MSEIADLTYNVVAFSEIMSMVWKRLNDHGKNWRHVYKVCVCFQMYLYSNTSHYFSLKYTLYLSHFCHVFNTFEAVVPVLYHCVFSFMRYMCIQWSRKVHRILFLFSIVYQSHFQCSESYKWVLTKYTYFVIDEYTIQNQYSTHVC